MDLLRGTAILLLLLWHAPAIPALYGYEMPSWLLALNDGFAPYRMPTLMFLSGMLLRRSLEKPAREYYFGKAQRLLWPYVIWAALYLAISGSEVAFRHPRAWVATGYLWFIFFLLAYYAIAPAVRYLPAWTFPLAAATISALLPDGTPKAFTYYAVFFFAGHFAAMHWAAIERALRSRILVALASVAAVSFGITSMLVDVRLQAVFAPLSISGIFAAAAAAKSLQGHAWLAPVRSIGKNSIVYYLTHFPIAIGIIVASGELGVGRLELVAPLSFAVALAVGALLARFRLVPPICWLFEAPRAERLKDVRDNSSQESVRTDGNLSKGTEAMPMRSTLDGSNNPI